MKKGQTVNLLAYAYDGSNPSPSTKRSLAYTVAKPGLLAGGNTLSTQAGVAQW